MAGKSTTETPQTFAQGLQSLIPQIATLMAAPDADIRFCQALMMACAGKLRQPAQGATAGVGGAGGPGGGMVGGAPAGPPTGAPGLGMPGGPAGGRAGNQQMPNLTGPTMTTPPGLSAGLSPTPDELRRVISTGAAGG